MMYNILTNIQIKNKHRLEETWNLFQSDTDLPPDLIIDIRSLSHHEYGLDLLTPQPGPAILTCESALLSANSDWSEAAITLLDSKDEGLQGAITACVMTHLSTHNGLLVHSSLIKVDGKAILFIGPSGIGKTTQAELWQKYRDACIINGDMSLIYYSEGQYWGCGCPWHGSSSYCENKRAVLSGIVVLEQAKENKLEQMHSVSMVERVMRNVFLPKWYEIGVEAAMNSLDGLLESVPVYLLRCQPDEEAVSLVESALLR